MGNLVEILAEARRKKEASAPKNSDFVNTAYNANSPEDDGRVPQVTYHVPIDNSSEIFTGDLNKDVDGKLIITADSTVEDHIYSQKYQASQHGTILPIDIKPTYPNKDFPASLIEDTSDADPLGVTFNSNPFYQKLAQKSLEEDFITTLKQPEQYPSWKALLPDLNALSLIGDPRWTEGYMLQGMLQWWWPKIQKYTDFLSSLGVTIKQNYLCDKEGNQIAENTPENLANLILTNNIDINSAPKLPTAEDIKIEFDRQKEQAFNKHADAFIKYIRQTFLEKQFFVEAYYFHPMRLFVFKCYKLNYKGGIINATYIKYYPDQIDYIISRLKVPIQQINRQGFNIHFKEGSMVEDIGKPIPDYTTLVKGFEED